MKKFILINAQFIFQFGSGYIHPAGLDPDYAFLTPV